MTETPNLNLPFIAPSQSQKHVTYNQAIQTLDSVVQLGVLDMDRQLPPDNPAEGDRYIIANGASGDWTAQDGNLAIWQDGAWSMQTPQTGWLAWIMDKALLYVFDGNDWTRCPSLNDLPGIGINTNTDMANRLAVKSDAVLFSHDDVTPGTGNIRHKLNKATTGSTASFLFQNNWSGRAEIGLTGDDDFHFKVSSDGANWLEGIRIAKDSGMVSFPNGGVRTQLAAEQHFYVRADGDDANEGLTDTAEGAFGTIQHAIDTATKLDLGMNAIYIHLGAGSYAENLQLRSYVGNGPITIQGNATTPSSVDVNGGSSPCIEANGIIGKWTLEGIRLSGSHNCLLVRSGSFVEVHNLEYNSTGTQIRVRDAGSVIALSDCDIVASGFSQHALVSTPASTYKFVNLSMGLPSGGCAITSEFAKADYGGFIHFGGAGFANKSLATGVRYAADTNGIIRTNGGGNDFLPGDVDGASTNGGLYT